MLGLGRVFNRSHEMNKANLYPYEFVTSGFARVDETRFLIEDQSEWDYCHDAAAKKANNLQAAQKFGFGPNFSPEEAALRRVLFKLNAGPHIMTYAWGLYSDIMKSENKSH